MSSTCCATTTTTIAANSAITNNNALHRRKAGKNKNKLKDHIVTPALAAAAAAQCTSTSQQKNERLQLSRENNKLENNLRNIAAAKFKIFKNAAATTPIATTNPAIINCCHDLNCTLNTNLSSSMITAQTTCSSSRRDCPNTLNSSRESSIASSCSGFSTTTTRSRSCNQRLPSKETTPISISKTTTADPSGQQDTFTLQINLDLISWSLFLLAFITRFYKLTYPRNVVFDELHYGRFIAMYSKNSFFFDQHPPLGKQLIAALAQSIGFDGVFNVTQIGSSYPANVPIFWLRFLPALCGSLLPSTVYHCLRQCKLSRCYCALGGVLVVFDNALLIQSRFILMESILLLFCSLALFFLLKFRKLKFPHLTWWIYGLLCALALTFAFSVKYVGFFTYFAACFLILCYLWDQLYDTKRTNLNIMAQTISLALIFIIIPICLYLGIFYIHLSSLYKAGPHDSVMTSAFQASLEGGLASITKGQPIEVAHGSQITLRNTYGQTCWLHSHAHLYPVRYKNKRGSSHQQQVSCYPFKDVNNWWIVKRPDKEDVTVAGTADPIRHGDIIQLVHGITSRALNTHDVAAPLTPQCQEVACYIDYEIGMPGDLLWKVEIINKEKMGDIWHAINSEVRLIHVSTKAALKSTGRQLPAWAFNQYEVAADRTINSKESIWNVEEHRYTKAGREHEKQLLEAEMIPTKPTKLTFLEKFLELQLRMIWFDDGDTEEHMYGSNALAWPLTSNGIAYWADDASNAQIFLHGNILIWYSGAIAVLAYFLLWIFYILRRTRCYFDIDEMEWQKFLSNGYIFLVAYFINYIPYFLVEKTLFLHYYFPALVLKIQLLSCMADHIDYLLRSKYAKTALWIVRLYRLAVLTWLAAVIAIHIRFWPLTYGLQSLSAKELLALRWKDTWDFVVHRSVPVRS